jgi:type IV pilus assembly protein PilA
MKTNNKGFSLVELIVVIAIMAILAAVAIPTFATFITKAQIASDVDYMNQVESAIELAYAQKGYDIAKVTVKHTNGVPEEIEVDFADEGVDNAIIKKNDTDSSAEKDAAAVIDWNYKFNKTDYNDLVAKDEAPDNWNKTGWSLEKYTAQGEETTNNPS